MEYVLKNASSDYLNPNPELYGKYLVCRDFETIAVFETELDALMFAEQEPAGTIEIRHITMTEDGTLTKVIVPGAIGYSPN